LSDYDLPISAMDRRRHRRAVVALVNQERRGHGLSVLRFSPRLSLSARSLAHALVRDSRFTHGDFAKRVLRFPFVLASRGRHWRVAETLAWGTGTDSTPRLLVARWMASPKHREIILGSWQYGAVWTENDAPQAGLQRDGVTVVQHFGRRG
jgi:uncharacterized protein YkwD